MKILVADDDSVHRAIMERLLTGWGHSVVTAVDGNEAFRHIESRPDLEVLLLDWMMPGLDGPEICRRVRAQVHEHYVFVILITSRSARKDFLEGMAAGADDFLTKPVDREELQVRLRTAERLIGLKSEVQVQEGINRKLRELDMMKTAFIFLTSHELRSPLAVLLPTLEFLEKEVSEENKGAHVLLDAANSSAQRLSGIVLRTLQLSHDGEYERKLCLEMTNPARLAADAVAEANVFAARRSQRIVVEIADNLPIVSLDCDKVKDALLNLLMNAVKFSHDGGEICLRVFLVEPETLCFEVIDRGTGIKEADKPHVFEKYFSTLDMMHHSSGSYEFCKRGIGLGLPIVKHFAELHGGTADFESTEAEGSRFRFRIPVVLRQD